MLEDYHQNQINDNLDIKLLRGVTTKSSMHTSVTKSCIKPKPKLIKVQQIKEVANLNQSEVKKQQTVMNRQINDEDLIDEKTFNNLFGTLSKY